VSIPYTNSSYESGCRTGGGTATNYFYLFNKIKKIVCINYDHHMSLITNIAFATIIGVALQDYEEYNNLRH
jgi:hypothetical protein